MAAAVLGLSGCAVPLDGLLPDAPAAPGGAAIAFVRTNLDPEKSTVTAGEEIRLWVDTNLPESRLRFAWTASAGRLSATSGASVRWTAGGSGRVRITCTISDGQNQRVAEYLFTVR